MIVFATDEDIALRASADFTPLCPKDQTLASGTDGAFAASDPWTLASASVNFATAGLAPGLMIRLIRPSTVFGPNGDLLVVNGVGPAGLALRRKGQGPGVGQPPAPPTGLTGVEFVIRTLGPQIQQASQDIDRRFGVNDLVVGRRTVDLLDPTELRQAVVLTVLYRQYFDQARQFSGPSDAPDDWYAAKARATKAELDEVLDRLSLHWNSADVAARAAATTRFSTRLSR